LGRHKLEIFMPEIGPIVTAAVQAAENLEEWNKPEKPAVEEWRSSWDTTIYTCPKGIVLIIGCVHMEFYLANYAHILRSPWNYPYGTTMLPFIGAIAAGCTVIIKPSEFNPTCAQLLADLFPKYLDSSVYRIVNGAVAETTVLLELKWNHIFFTGSGHVGRIVAAAAAKNVTPITLELGSKSPVFIDAANTDVDLAAKRILWGKMQNGGQVCALMFIMFTIFNLSCCEGLRGPRLHLGSAGPSGYRSGGVQEGLPEVLASSQGSIGSALRTGRHPESTSPCASDGTPRSYGGKYCPRRKHGRAQAD
jgi:hypothetical protein